MTPAEKLAKKVKRASNPIPWGQRIAARRPSKFRCKIKELRLALGLTQLAVAEAVGTKGPTINDAESGREIHLSLAIKIAAFFGKSVEEIWEPIGK